MEDIKQPSVEFDTPTQTVNAIMPLVAELHFTFSKYR